ncbi:phosphatidate cytidylyltransferase [Lactococcus hodotermopsidis]|uniref:Phosphatidate cytidylyltransferase n=1 Tax=Pseudolactococcus hodotermopsidis TaxID=2709157 RepID=A0A6A0BB42_9LACT|nr:phosphatidate cytidylyltransferase [Lactococcus hodotermopsidis]GFH41584.1 phosphatidate cytidylyltransferase [Lactococcus hodotermopsidis]
MKQRIITGVVAGAVFLGLAILGGTAFHVLVALLVMIAMTELFKMRKLEILSFEGILATIAALSLSMPTTLYLPKLGTDSNLTLFTLFLFIMMGIMVFTNGKYSFEDLGFPFLSAFYIGIGFQNLLAARENSLFIFFLALFIVWATDSGAYFVGRKIGKTKLIPSVSPNKTVEGSLGGVISAIVVAAIMVFLYPNQAPEIGIFRLIILVAIFSIVGQLGDLVESSLKRYFGVKDSGKILPGHGGILDRFDSMIFVFPIMHLLGLF